MVVGRFWALTAGYVVYVVLSELGVFASGDETCETFSDASFMETPSAVVLVCHHALIMSKIYTL